MSDSLEQFVGAALQELESDSLVTGEKAGLRIGNYTLVECIGQGGFGAVWRAAQSEPVRRQVALKIIKMGMDTQEVTARFEQERQALAVMDHPGIAKVFDAGATPSGRPYFVMELVRGTRINRFCDEAALTLQDRLSLFIDVCDAVRHAHLKGVIHRDLKPSNLLITQVDARPTAKVIDFGIAKATGGERLADHTVVTRMGRLMGTPAYMSPEQSQPGRDIDTRADVYSLGVVLYELITGRVPFDAGKDGSGPRNGETKRPSTMLRTETKEELTRICEARRTEGQRLIRQVKGDLDWIVVKALEHDRGRRYGSADALAEDLRAFLEQRPVAARPPTAWYLAQLAQRHKAGTAASLVVVLALIAGVSVSTVMYYRAKRALTRSWHVTRFLQDTLAQAGPSRALGRDTTMLREVLDKTSQRIATELHDQPEAEADLRYTLGWTYMDLGDYEGSHMQSTEALRLRRAMSGKDSVELADTLFLHALAIENRGKFQEAEPVLREALAMRQRLYGPDDPKTAQLHIELAWVLKDRRAWDEAEASARIAVDIWRKYPGNRLLPTAPPALAAILGNTQRHEEALSLFREDLEVHQKQFGPEHPEIAACLDNLGHHLCKMKRFDEAEPLLLEGLRQGKLFYNDRFPNGSHILAALSSVAASRKQWDRQLEFAREGLASAGAVFVPDHSYYRGAASLLAKVLLEHAERQAKSDPQRTLELLDELKDTKALETAAQQAEGWLDCLCGAALAAAGEDSVEGRAVLERGIAALKAKEKPGKEDPSRLKKAEGFLQDLGLSGEQ